MPLAGGKEEKVIDEPAEPRASWFNWGLGRTGIYVLNVTAEPNGRIDFFDFATRKMTPIFDLQKPAPFYGGMTVSPDGRSLLFVQSDFDDSSIMLMKNFQ
jgi:hypothetical protein